MCIITLFITLNIEKYYKLRSHTCGYAQHPSPPSDGKAATPWSPINTNDPAFTTGTFRLCNAHNLSKFNELQALERLVCKTEIDIYIINFNSDQKHLKTIILCQKPTVQRTFQECQDYLQVSLTNRCTFVLLQNAPKRMIQKK